MKVSSPCNRNVANSNTTSRVIDQPSLLECTTVMNNHLLSIHMLSLSYKWTAFTLVHLYRLENLVLCIVTRLGRQNPEVAGGTNHSGRQVKALVSSGECLLHNGQRHSVIV